MSKKLKAGLYSILSKPAGKMALKLLSKLVYVPNLKKSSNNKNKKFLVAITIDTESGFVKKNNERVWQKSSPTAYIGYYKGIENWRNLLNKHQAKATFFLSTNCFSAKSHKLEKIKNQLKLAIKERHEIGLHMHPDSDLALQEELNEKFEHTSAKFYSYDNIKKFVATGKSLIKRNTGINPASFRWGNWGLDTNAVKALQETGFKADSSATPGIKGHLNDRMHYDWSKASEHYPWKLSIKNYQNTEDNNSNIIEMPIATFNFIGSTLRADPVYSEFLKTAFRYYYKNAERSKKPFVFVIISHSIEATNENGGTTQVIRDMEDFIEYAKKFNDVEFVTISEAYNRIK